MKKTMLIAVALALCSGCKTMSAAEKQALIDCGTKAVADQLPTLVPQVTQALDGQTPNWNSDLTTLIMAAGDAGVCALEVVIANLEKQPSPILSGGTAPAERMPASMALSRAYAYKAAHPYSIK